MNRLIICLLAISVLSCQKQTDTAEQPTPPSDQMQIRLSTEVSTKGTLVTTASIEHFVTFGFYTNKKSWAEAVADKTATPNLMNNVSVDKVDGSWVYTPVVYWTDREMNTNYSFFGYSPRATADNGLTLLTNGNTVGYQRLKYQTLSNVEKHVDLVISSRIDYSSTADVRMNFKHALSRIGLRAFTNIPGTTVKSFKISNLLYKGEVNVCDDPTKIKWDIDNSATTEFAVTFIPELSVSVDRNQPTDLTLDGRWACVVLPQDLAANGGAKLEVTYVQGGAEITKSYTMKEHYQVGQGTVYEVNLEGIPTAELLVSKVELTDWTFGGKWNIDSSEGTVE